MGNNTGHARRLEIADDASASGLRDALDLSIADPADTQILDDQTVQEVLESGPYPVLDQSIGDSQDDKDNTALARTYVLKPSTLTERMSLEELAELAEDSDETEASTMDLQESAEK